MCTAVQDDYYSEQPREHKYTDKPEEYNHNNKPYKESYDKPSKPDADYKYGENGYGAGGPPGAPGYAGTPGVHGAPGAPGVPGEHEQSAADKPPAGCTLFLTHSMYDDHV